MNFPAKSFGKKIKEKKKARRIILNQNYLIKYLNIKKGPLKFVAFATIY